MSKGLSFDEKSMERYLNISLSRNPIYNLRNVVAHYPFKAEPLPMENIDMLSEDFLKLAKLAQEGHLEKETFQELVKAIIALWITVLFENRIKHYMDTKIDTMFFDNVVHRLDQIIANQNKI